MTDQELAARIAANAKDRQLAAMVAEENPGPAFIETLFELVPSLVPEPDNEPLTPMTRAEADEFEQSTMPWGKFMGHPIHDIPIPYLASIESSAKFQRQLKRYLLRIGQ